MRFGDGMMRFALLVLVGLAISLGCELGFVLEAHTGSQFKNMYLLGYVVATFGLFFFAARSMTLWSLVGLGCLVALLSVLDSQLLGFCCFPGLVKDVEPFQWFHLLISTLQLLTAVGWYVIVACVASAATKIIRRLQVLKTQASTVDPT